MFLHTPRRPVLPILDTTRKKKNIRRSFVKNLSKIIKNRLKTDGHNFDVNLFKEIVLKSLAEIG